MAKKRVVKFKYQPTLEDRQAMSICHDNDCYIYPLPLDDAGSRYKLQVFRPEKVNPKNRLKTDEKVYSSLTSDWYQKIFELYNHLKKDYVKEKKKIN